MFIDKQTLADLDIFKPDETGLSLFDFINKTITKGGNQRLHDKLLNPPESIEKLLLQQDAIKFFSQNPDKYNLPFNNRQINLLEIYLSSNIEVINNDSITECLRFYLSDINAYRQIRNSLKDIVSFIFVFQTYCNYSGKNDVPVLLKNISDEISSFINDADFANIKTVFSKKRINFFDVLKSDRSFRTKLKAKYKSILNYYFEIDSLLSLAKTTAENNFQFPVFAEDESSIFYAENLYHPLLNNAIPSNIEINKNSNFIFLTGPNMAGKTTFLKATGIAVYLAHLGMGIPAKSIFLSYFDRLFTSINIPDNVLNGYSYFYSEVKRVKQLAEALNQGEKVFTLLDELFRGTNVKDAYDASLMIISGLVQWNNSAFILSSHLLELWENITVFKNTKSFYFESEINNGIPVFSYRMLSGVSEMRLGLTIVENENIMNLLNRNKNNGN